MAREQLTDVEWEFIRPYLPIGEYGPYPERLRQQFEGVIWRFRTGGQWREMPKEFGAWPTVHNRFRQWRDAGVFEALPQDLIAEAAKRGEVDLSLVSVDSTTARAHHDAAGMHLDLDIVAALEKATSQQDGARQMVFELREQTGERTGAIARVADQLGVHREALRTWIRQTEVDGGQRPGRTTSDAQRIGELEREVRELRRANEILKAASAYFARELDPRLPR